MIEGTASPSVRLRSICLSLPSAEERQTWGDPTFRVNGKIFAMEKRGDGRISVWAKAAEGIQSLLVDADPYEFFRPPYVGHRGWIGIWLDADPDWEQIEDLVKRSYSLVAPKKLASLLPDAPSA